MKTKLLSTLAICVALAGCTASQRHLSSDYKGYGFNTFETPRGTYKVVDNPETGKLFILPTAGYVLSKGTPPEAEARAAAMFWLDKTRRHCTITESHLYQAPHWEFFYHCRK
ncbi:MAG: hypothetical protein K0R10_2639 [Alphaproteobacteria bacterium]|jgi:hypothetical protein|nr:hypothetical protein [Alphaproteobacteria bacterium]